MALMDGEAVDCFRGGGMSLTESFDTQPNPSCMCTIADTETKESRELVASVIRFVHENENMPYYLHLIFT